MNALTELFRRKPEATADAGVSQAQEAPGIEMLADIAYGDATDIGHEQRLKILDDAEKTLRAAMKEGIPEQVYQRYVTILAAIPASRNASKLLAS